MYEGYLTIVATLVNRPLSPGCAGLIMMNIRNIYTINPPAQAITTIITTIIALITTIIVTVITSSNQNSDNGNDTTSEQKRSFDFDPAVLISDVNMIT